jgi:hypothetical protein
MLPKEVQERIRQDAMAFARSYKRKEIGYYSLNYTAGATAEAERSMKLVNSLNKLNEVLDELWNLAGTCHIPERYIKAINMAQHESYQALNEYSNPKN